MSLLWDLGGVTHQSEVGPRSLQGGAGPGETEAEAEMQKRRQRWFLCPTCPRAPRRLTGPGPPGPPAGAYRKEEAHWLLKASHVKGPGDVFVSKFENDTWGLDGSVSTRVRAVARHGCPCVPTGSRNRAGSQLQRGDSVAGAPLRCMTDATWS